MIKNGKKILLFLLVSIILFGSIAIVQAQTCDTSCPSNDLTCITNKIVDCNSKISTLQSQANTLANQIAQFNYQINLTTLQIAQTEQKIVMLGGRIGELETSLDNLTKAFSSRAVETYKLSRFENNFTYLLTASDINDAVARFHYLQKIQEADTSLLERLQEAQTTYKSQKTDQETLQKQLQQQQANLNAQKVAKANLLATTQNDEARYRSLLTAAIRQRNAFSNFVTRQGGASILQNQTVQQAGWPGYYFNQRESEWGNVTLGSSAFTMATDGCLVTSVAMIGTHLGRSIRPIDIANTISAFYYGTPQDPTAYLYWNFSVNNMNVILTSQSVSQVDQLLQSGPIIVGLFSGPDHYIVLKSGSNGNYVMNDPFLENGGDRNFSDKYSVSNITAVFTVSFN